MRNVVDDGRDSRNSAFAGKLSITTAKIRSIKEHESAFTPYLTKFFWVCTGSDVTLLDVVFLFLWLRELDM